MASAGVEAARGHVVGESPSGRRFVSVSRRPLSWTIGFEMWWG